MAGAKLPPEHDPAQSLRGAGEALGMKASQSEKLGPWDGWGLARG